jgi:hypothetical protein
MGGFHLNASMETGLSTNDTWTWLADRGTVGVFIERMQGTLDVKDPFRGDFDFDDRQD